MALVGEKLASDATLDKVLCICSGRRPKETCTEGLAYKGPNRGVATSETGMDFNHELTSLFFGDTSLKYSGDAFLVELSVMDLVGFRVPDYAASLIPVLRELSPIKVRQKGFIPWGDHCRDYMGR